MGDAGLFILILFATMILAFIGYCVALGVMRTVGDDDRAEYRMVRYYLKGLYYGLMVSGVVVVGTFPLLAIWLIGAWITSVAGFFGIST